MKVLVPGKPIAKTSIGDCPKCEAICQEKVSDLLPSSLISLSDKSLGAVNCPNCGIRIRMHPLDSDYGRTLLAKVAAYETKEYARNAAGFKP